MAASSSICQFIERIAPTPTPVLFTGETGVGKSFFARYLHKKGSPDGAVFCEVPSIEFVDGVLPAVMAKKPDTLFFSEISEMSLEMQKVLVRFIAEFPVRILASSTKNLEQLKEKDLFSPELYGILSAMPIHVPPLRKRKADIVPLAKEFLTEYNTKNNKSFSFSDSALQALEKHVWQGNVTELKDTIHKVCSTVAVAVIDEKDLFLQNDGLSKSQSENSRSLKSAIDTFKKQYIIQILAENNWNKTATAKVLEIERTYLSRLIKELHI